MANPINMPELLNVWGMTDEAIQAWHWVGNWGTVIQALLLLGVVVFGMMMIIRYLRKLPNEKTPES